MPASTGWLASLAELIALTSRIVKACAWAENPEPGERKRWTPRDVSVNIASLPRARGAVGPATSVTQRREAQNSEDCP
jgi:hypothetical protein